MEEKVKNESEFSRFLKVQKKSILDPRVLNMFSKHCRLRNKLHIQCVKGHQAL